MSLGGNVEFATNLHVAQWFDVKELKHKRQPEIQRFRLIWKIPTNKNSVCQL